MSPFVFGTLVYRKERVLFLLIIDIRRIIFGLWQGSRNTQN